MGTVPGATGRLAWPASVQRSHTIRCRVQKDPSGCRWGKAWEVPRADTGSPVGRLPPLSSLGEHWRLEKVRCWVS